MTEEDYYKINLSNYDGSIKNGDLMSTMISTQGLQCSIPNNVTMGYGTFFN